jgi:hypothetical protein
MKYEMELMGFDNAGADFNSSRAGKVCLHPEVFINV